MNNKFNCKYTKKITSFDIGKKKITTVRIIRAFVKILFCMHKHFHLIIIYTINRETL